MGSKLDSLFAQREALREQVAPLNVQVRTLNEAIAKLEDEIERAQHTCVCVRLNGEIGIHDTAMQEQQGRKGLGFGLVSKNLSAEQNCPVCHGTGRADIKFA